MKNNIKNILFINFGGLGDEILFLPAINSVRKTFPEAKITLALEPRSKGILMLTNDINELLLADIKGKNKYFELLKLLFKIWTKKFDIVISSGSNKFISLFLFLTFIPKRIGYYSGKMSKYFLSDSIKLNKNQYAAKMYHDLVSSICNKKCELPEIAVKTTDKTPNTILIHPGVSKLSIQKNMIKTVPAEIWAQVCEKLADLGKEVWLAGGPDDEDVINKIQELVGEEKYKNFYGKTGNLAELATLISGAEKFLCSDSAPLHIASALKTKTYVIFGSTDEKKLIPSNGLVIPIRKECSCPLVPCLWEKRQTTCETLDCLKLTSDEIVDKIMNF